MSRFPIVCLLWSVIAPWVALAQQGEEIFSFLRYPVSARVNALGGNNISLVERDPSMVFHNPALLGAEMDGMLNVSYMNFVTDIHAGSALFTKVMKESGTWGVGARFISYGTFQQTTAEKWIEGEFSAEDISVNAFYSHDLSDKWRGGLSLQVLYSSVESYSSIGLAIDAGLSYYDSDKDFAAALALKHIGAQLKTYYEERRKLPWDVQLGMSKRLEHAPVRVSFTAMYLNQWNFSYVDDVDNAYEKDKIFQTLMKHFVIGVDFLPSDNFWLGVGFNPKTHYDMKMESGNGLGGFSAGGGVRVSKFDVGVSVARYHPSALSLMVSLSTSLNDFRP